MSNRSADDSRSTSTGTLAVVALAVASACAGGEAESTVALADRIDTTSQETLVCAPAPSPPPTEFTIVLDTVALPTAGALQTNRRIGADDEPYFFAKTGLWFRGDAEFEIAVPDDLEDQLAIAWGTSGELPSHSVSADCDLDVDWAGGPGGYWVTEPICAEIIVRVGGEEQRQEIGIGAACPGQQPPPSPSDS